MRNPMEEFDAENAKREALFKSIQNCKTLGELIEILKKNPTIAGEDTVFSGKDMAAIFAGVHGGLGADRGTETSQHARKIVIEMALHHLTRSFGIRKRAAELLGCDHIFDKEFLEGTGGAGFPNSKTEGF